MASEMTQCFVRSVYNKKIVILQINKTNIENAVFYNINLNNEDGNMCLKLKAFMYIHGKHI